MHTDDPTSAWVRRAVQGDRVALTMLLTQAHDPLAARLARRIPATLRGVIDPDDVLQEAFTDVFRHIEAFEPRDENAFERWLATIVVRRLRNAVRAHRAAKRGGGRTLVQAPERWDQSVASLLDLIECADRSPSRSVAGREAVATMRAALDRLPQSHREAVQLVYLDGIPVAEAAARLGRTERAIHNLCYKAKLQLRELLGNRSRYLSSSE